MKKIVAEEKEVMSLWDYDKNSNIGIEPHLITIHSKKKVWWKCENGHSYDMIVCNKVINGYGCPICSNKRVLKGYNDIESTEPFLMKEWDYDNNSILPSTITSKSGKKVWWKCSRCNHSFLTAPHERSKGNGCPKCYKGKRTSFPEQAIFYYVSQQFPDAISTHQYELVDGSKFEIDIFVPSLNLGIEYDGLAYHESDDRIMHDIKKDKALLSEQIRLIRIREKGLVNDGLLSEVIQYEIGINYSNLDNLIIKLFIIAFDISINPNINKDRFNIWSNYIDYEEKNSLASMRTEVLLDCNYDKNKGISPNQIKEFSSKKVWWKCHICAYEWEAPVSRITFSKSTCLCCAGKVATKEKNLLLHNPILCKEWDYEKNYPLKPENFLPISGKTVWWKCHKGHSWKSKISNRQNGNNCPICYNGVHSEYNLEVINSKLANEWDYDLNNNLTPKDVTPNSHKKVWWKCSLCGYSWQAVIGNRNKFGHKCPNCLGTGNEKRSFIYEYPELAKEWDYTLNEKEPILYTKGSSYNAHWICSKCNNSFRKTIKSRTTCKNVFCPICKK